MLFYTIRGFAAYFIKVFLTTCVLAALLFLAISLRFNITFDYILNESDPEIEAELEGFLDPSTFLFEIIDALPMDFVSWLSNFEILKDIFTIHQSADIKVENAQNEIFISLAFGMFVFLIHKIVLFIYQYIRKFADHIAGKNLISDFGGVICFLQIAYLGTIIAILMKDLAIEKFYDTSPVLMFLVYIVAISAIWGLDMLIGKSKNITAKEKLAKEAGNLAKDALFSACCIFASASVLTLMTLVSNGEDIASSGSGIFTIICACVSTLAVVVVGSLRFANSDIFLNKQ